jgi:uncharacterized protein
MQTHTRVMRNDLQDAVTLGLSADGQSLPMHLLVIQSTPFCNINCDYCYLPDRQSTRRLSLDTLGHIFRQFFASSFVGPQLSIVWHAGEPLVTPLSFYEAAFQKIRDLNVMNCDISHCIQTNGMLITQEWCNFIKQHSVNIGISIDGPAFLHDAHRKTRNGKGTHHKVMHGISLLQRNHIEFHVITVLTQQSLDFPDEIFQFLVDTGITRVGFNIEELEGANTTSSLQREATEQRYRAFMKRMYQLTKAAQGALRVREFDRAYNLICTGPPMVKRQAQILPFNDQVIPFSITSVDCDGNFSTFSPELLGHDSSVYGNFILGNVLRDTFDSIYTTDKFQTMNHDIEAGIDLCRKTCQYFELCGGGAPANKYFEHGSFRSAETMYCRYTIQTPIDIVLEDLESSVAINTTLHTVIRLCSSLRERPGGK